MGKFPNIYIYKENVIQQIEIENRSVHAPHDAPICVTKKVNVPVNEENLKYVPTIIEKEKVYEIPKLEIYDGIEENLFYLHKNEIQYETKNSVVERIIPQLKNKIIGKTVHVPFNFIKEFNDLSIYAEHYPCHITESENLCFDATKKTNQTNTDRRQS